MGNLRMISEREQQEYFAARDRSVTRIVSARELEIEAVPAFLHGLRVASKLIPVDRALDTSLVVPESTFGFNFVLGLCARMEAVKGKQYAGSWMKRGEKDGALVNVQRKFDRLEQAILHPEIGGDDTACDTMGDGLVYYGKWLTLRARTHPAEFENWMMSIMKL